MLRKIWTTQEDDIMCEKYPHIQTNDLCKLLNRPYSSVSNRAYFLGIKKSEAFLKSDLSGRLTKLSESGKVYRYQKGHTPFNKGKPMPSEVYEKVKHTMFKKGQTSLNALPIGNEVNRFDKRTGKSYVMIKIESSLKLVYKHTYVWQQHYGKVAKGYNIVFKDGNSMNCIIENLECISNAELMARNTIHRYPEELKSTIKIISKLNKRIKEHEKQS